MLLTTITKCYRKFFSYRQKEVVLALSTFLVLCVSLLVVSACVPNAVRQQYLDEELWEKTSKKSDIDYFFTEVTPSNFPQVFAEAEERFSEKCRWNLSMPDNEPYIYRLGIGDEVMIKVNAISGDTKYFSQFGRDLVHILPESNVESILSSYKVSTDGYLSLPYIGKVQAEGMTTSQIEELLLQQLSVYYNQAFVEVKLFKFLSKWVEVVGAVNKISRIPIDSAPMTVQRAIIASNGLGKDADLREAFIQKEDEKVPVDLYALLYEGDERFNFRMEHGDVLVIPETKRDRIFLTGEVLTRRVVETDFHQYSLSDILVTDKDTISVVFNNTKNMVYVLRSRGLRHETSLCPSYLQPDRPMIQVFKFDLRMPQMLMIASSFHLQHRDIVYVSTSTSQMWRRTLDLLFPSSITPFVSPFVNPTTYAE